MKYTTVDDAAHAWVESFNAIPQRVIEKLMQLDPDDVTEITPLCIGDTVSIWTGDEEIWGEIVKTESRENDTVYTVLYNGAEHEHTSDDICLECSGTLPMWGTMWTFGSSFDEMWLEDPKHLQKMADCGFRIYEQEDFGILFGIDGAGYDFYEAHWIPLYRAFGFKWHIDDDSGECA